MSDNQKTESGENTDAGKTENTVQPTQQPSTVTLTTDQLFALVDKFQTKGSSKDDLKDVIAGLAKAIEPDYAGKRLYNEADIDKDDYLKIPAVFYTYVSYYSIHSENRYGHEVNTPYGRPIQFHSLSSHIVGNGRLGKELRQLSVAKIVTKKEADWLRNSPKYQITFYETLKDVATVDVFRAQKLQEASAEVGALDVHSMVEKAKSLGIADHPDRELMKYQLINKLAEIAIQNERKFQTSPLSMDNDFNRESDRTKIVRQPINA